MIIQLSVDVEVSDKEEYDSEGIKKLKRTLIDSIRQNGFGYMGGMVTASWQNYKKYEYNDQSWE